MDAYLDIETTGLSAAFAQPTVVGIAVDFPGDWFVEQLVGDDITVDAILHILEGVTTVYTFNGASFDLPFLARRPGVDIRSRVEHHDLRWTCYHAGLTGGLKVIERKLRISRNLPDINGRDAVDLWHKYHNEGNRDALDMLLEYNREDVENLHTLRKILERNNNRR